MKFEFASMGEARKVARSLSTQLKDTKAELSKSQARVKELESLVKHQRDLQNSYAECPIFDD